MIGILYLAKGFYFYDNKRVNEKGKCICIKQETETCTNIFIIETNMTFIVLLNEMFCNKSKFELFGV